MGRATLSHRGPLSGDLVSTYRSVEATALKKAEKARDEPMLRLDPAIVTKDYFVYVALREITARYPNAMFKGGTSLSKCHKAIT